MPLYEYQCEVCATRTEVLQRIDDPPPAACPQCGGPLKKLLSAPAVHFKGSGWYVTDYAGKGSRAASETGGDGGKKEAARPAESGTGGSGGTSSPPAGGTGGEKSAAAAPAATKPATGGSAG